MSKEKFLESLKKKLSILEESEIEDILTEYDGYIEEKIAKGTSEEDAVKSMGDVDELARELLSAYKIKTGEEKNHDGINNLLDSFLNIFDRIISVFAHKSFNEIVKFIIELVCIFIIIAVCKIPFEIIEGMGKGIFSSFGNPMYHVFFGIWHFILEFAYLIFAILLFIKIFESRYLNGEYESVLRSEKKSVQNDIPKSEMKKERTVKVAKEKKENSKERTEHREFSVVDSLAKVCILFIKFILLFVLFGVVCYVVGMSLALGLAIYCLICGVTYFGIYIILLALFVLGIIAFIFLFNFIFDHKNKVGVLLITTLISFVLLGIGTGICALEFANTTIIYSENIENQKIEDYTFKMQDNLVLSRNFYNDIVIDDNLKDEIKVEYTYDDTYIKLQPDSYIRKEGKYDVLHITYHITNFEYKKELLDKFITDLKNKTIVAHAYDNVDMKVYMSNASYDKLVENYKKFYREDNDLDDICEELEELGYSLPGYCRNLDVYQEM